MMNMREERQETNSAERGMIMITGGMKEEEIGIMIGIDYVFYPLVFILMI